MFNFKVEINCVDFSLSPVASPRIASGVVPIESSSLSCEGVHMADG